MRVIGGTARSLPLKTVPGLQTRPTTDRIKETLFNMLNPYLPGSSFLDLFSGSGAIGIEALSRGASHAVFVDRDNACCNVIRENLAFTHLDAHSEVLRKDALSAVAFLEGRREAFDIIFMDPPYASDGVGTVLERLDGSSLVAPHTILIFEEDIRFPLDFIDGLSFEVMKEKKYKTNKHVWLKKV
ncbi:MAG: 16S rRNA (guanine(966)-N(2))-methyltransferase RsmD [Lachnospiraceae bacterium]|nr:16S rRNA (guanine(966)-N(2))-methyltransferase RsmD [Lachnospiraceae bacterium]